MYHWFSDMLNCKGQECSSLYWLRVGDKIVERRILGQRSKNQTCLHNVEELVRELLTYMY